MKLIDITRELTAAPVFPGDRAPELVRVKRMENGDLYNLTELRCCLHNGTHADAPRHFFPDGSTVDQIGLPVWFGDCLVAEADGIMMGDDAEKLAADNSLSAGGRLLLKGDVSLSPSAAFVLSGTGIQLLGVEGQSVAAPEHAVPVHRQLLGAGMVLIEGLDLSAAEPGRYTLIAFPLLLAGCEGAPVRAVLARREELDLVESFLKNR
ncbi:MAG: cyclase family protein [Oscillospiraceae bacterium]|nr:cyclase family protein [Oscillospiraceae bacterium]